MNRKKTLLLEEDYLDKTNSVLLAIYTSVEVYKLAYFINKRLEINLTLYKEEIELVRKKIKSSYLLYTYFDADTDLSFYLCANKAKISSSNSNPLNLFPDQYERYEFLIPERPRVDYFLKIQGTGEMDEWREELKKTKHIEAVFNEDIQYIKSYRNLIFE